MLWCSKFHESLKQLGAENHLGSRNMYADVSKITFENVGLVSQVCENVVFCKTVTVSPSSWILWTQSSSYTPKGLSSVTSRGVSK